MDIKKTLKTAGIGCLVASLLCIVSLLNNIFLFEFSLFYIIQDIITIVLSIVTGIIYLCHYRKPKEKLLKQRKLFFTLSIINIFNNLIVWVMSFWVQIVFNKELRAAGLYRVFNANNNGYNGTNNKETNNPDVIIIDESDYEIKHSTQTLTSRLEELKDLRSKNLISEEEYENLRQEALRKFMS